MTDELVFLQMAGFKRRTSGFGSDHFANCSTTTSVCCQDSPSNRHRLLSPILFQLVRRIEIIFFTKLSTAELMPCKKHFARCLFQHTADHFFKQVVKLKDDFHQSWLKAGTLFQKKSVHIFFQLSDEQLFAKSGSILLLFDSMNNSRSLRLMK